MPEAQLTEPLDRAAEKGGAAHPCRDQARGAKVHSLCVQESTPHALSAVPAKGLCISSGVVEAGCKQIGDRLKRAGMRWTVAGANAIIALRCSILSGRFEDFWERRAKDAA